jgi:hypothetical protein
MVGFLLTYGVHSSISVSAWGGVDGGVFTYYLHPGADIDESIPYVSKNPTIYLHPGADIDKRKDSICK